MALSKAAILGVTDFKIEKVAVPEWGGDVYMRTITGLERDLFEDSYSEKKMRAFRVRFLVLTLCDEKGERLFSDEEIDVLGKKSSAVINRLFEKAWELNAFTNNAVETLGNGSASDQSGGSISA